MTKACKISCISLPKRDKLPFRLSLQIQVVPFLLPVLDTLTKKLREIIVTAIMFHEYPFSIVDDDVWVWGFQYANPDFHKVEYMVIK